MGSWSEEGFLCEVWGGFGACLEGLIMEHGKWARPKNMSKETSKGERLYLGADGEALRIEHAPPAGGAGLASFLQLMLPGYGQLILRFLWR